MMSTRTSSTITSVLERQRPGFRQSKATKFSFRSRAHGKPKKLINRNRDSVPFSHDHASKLQRFSLFVLSPVLKTIKFLVFGMVGFLALLVTAPLHFLMKTGLLLVQLLRGRTSSFTMSKSSLSASSRPEKGSFSQRLKHLSRQLRFIIFSTPENLAVNSERRLFALTCMSLIFAIGIVLRLYNLQGTEFSKWQQIAARQHEASIEVHGARGSILDAEGRTLAASVKAVSIGAHPKDLKLKELSSEARENVIASFSKTLGRTPEEVREKLLSDKSFVWLARGLPTSAADDMKSQSIPGLVTAPEFRRYYPQGSIAGTLLGHVGRDGDGLSGIERSFEQILSAPNLSLPVRRDARGRLLTLETLSGEGIGSETALQILSSESNAWNPWGATPVNAEPVLRKEGESISLTIDSLMQGIFEEELERGRQEAQAKRTFGLLLDAENGEILALAQNPGFNPNESERIHPEDLRNSVIQDAFEPGSTLKPIVAAAALDAHVIQSSQNFDCENGTYAVGSHIVRDVHPSGVLPFPDVLIRSSNICMAKIGQKLGEKQLFSTLKEFGFGDTTAVQLPGESKGILRDIKSWSDIDIATHSFGQGLSVTALQIAEAYSALANSGLLVTPTLIKRKTPENRRVLSAGVADEVSDILRGVIENEHGTGQKAAIPGVIVRGKTGTAQKARSDGRGYDPDKILASFVGFVKGPELGLGKKLVMVVAVDEPGVKPRWGGAVAAPIFKRAMGRILTHMLTKQDNSGTANANNRS